VAKELMNGQPVVIVRCEGVNISGSLFRNQLKFTEYLNKRTNTNPARGPIHFRSPGRIVTHTIRGMMAHKTARGQAAMARLKTFEGVPHPYDKMKKKVTPDALRYLRLRPGRKYCTVGDLAHAFGWKHKDLIGKLETKRLTKATAYHSTKKALAAVKKSAEEKVSAQLAPILAKLAAYGYGPAHLAEKKEEKAAEKPAGKPAAAAAAAETAPAKGGKRETKAETKAAPKAAAAATAATAEAPAPKAAKAPKEPKEPKEPKGKKGGAGGGEAPKEAGKKPAKGKKPADAE